MICLRIDSMQVFERVYIMIATYIRGRTLYIRHLLVSLMYVIDRIYAVLSSFQEYPYRMRELSDVSC